MPVVPTAEPVSVQPGAMSALLAELFRAPERLPRDELPLPPGTRVGRFELRAELGRGGFGVVYEAHDVELGRSVAFKVVRPGRRNAAREGRLLLEAEAAARLSHPNIVTLFDLGRSEFGPYLVLELLRGETVGARTARGPIPRDEALRIATEAARGLAHAHACGVVHRDLAPGNVFLCDDRRVKILDLGMAHAFGREKLDGGTPGYMAPEQRDGHPEDARTDVYALGALLVTMLGREPPERGLARGERLAGLPKGRLGRAITRMLARLPGERFPDAGQALEELVQASPERAAARRNTWLATAAAAAAIAAFVAGGLWLSRPTRVELPGASVGVLPFEDLSPTKDQAHLAEGLAQEVQGALARVGTLRVAGFGSARRARGLSPAEAGARLQVAALVAGTLRREGDALEVTARLLRGADGEELWSRRFTAATSAGAFDLQARIAAAMVEALGLRSGGTPAAPAHAPVPEAYERYLRARAWVDAERDDRWPEVMAEARRAVELDPAFAQAWAFLGIASYSQLSAGPISHASRCATALTALDRAVELGPELGGVRAQRGWMRVQCGLDWEGAREDLRRARELEPGASEVWRLSGVFELQDGARFDAAIPAFRKAADLDPLLPRTWSWLGRACWGAGRIAEARVAIDRAVALAPGVWTVSLQGYLDLEEGRPEEALRRFAEPGSSETARLRGRALAYHDLGREAEAQAQLDELVRRYGDESLYAQATIHAWWGDTERALAALEKHLARGTPGTPELRWDPLLRRLRADPRCQALLRRAGIPE